LTTFRRLAGGRVLSEGPGGGEVAVLGVALILYVAAIVALAHALARE
jgi:hypothetical protein